VHDDPAADPITHDLSDSRPVDPATDASARWPIEPVELTADPSDDATVCPFLRAVDDADRLLLPILSPDPVNRCASSGEPVPQSLRQQELVCLTSGHVNCPRFQRGTIQEPAPLEVPIRLNLNRSVHVTPATAGAIAVFLVAFAISLGFMVANGGLALTAAETPRPTEAVLGAIETTPPPTLAPTAIPTPDAASDATPSPSPSPEPAATPTPTPTAAPTATAPPAATPKPTPRPSSGRYALLTPCPNQSGCWIYVIRSGDNLYSIARYFGVPLATVKAWNPWTANGLRVGRELRMPPPTR
jgi:LysM domain-containing protein